MNGNAELLNYIYQNSQMGLDTIKQLTNVTSEPDFTNHLKNQLEEYEKINSAAKQKLHKCGCIEKDISGLTKTSAAMSIGMNTLTDKSPRHIAEMMIQGSTMGVIDATKNIKKYSGASQDILDLANQLCATEQNNIESLKQFL